MFSQTEGDPNMEGYYTENVTGVISVKSPG